MERWKRSVKSKSKTDGGGTCGGAKSADGGGVGVGWGGGGGGGGGGSVSSCQEGSAGKSPHKNIIFVSHW